MNEEKCVKYPACVSTLTPETQVLTLGTHTRSTDNKHSTLLCLPSLQWQKRQGVVFVVFVIMQVCVDAAPSPPLCVVCRVMLNA